MSDDITQVYVVTSGSYSAYGIVSVWLTREQAEACIPPDADEYEGPRVEVWPVGERDRTVGTFKRHAIVDPETAEVSIMDIEAQEEPELIPAGHCSTAVFWWSDPRLYWGRMFPDKTIAPFDVSVMADTRERCDKVFGELLARVKANISMGLPPETIATHIKGRGDREWHEHDAYIDSLPHFDYPPPGLDVAALAAGQGTTLDTTVVPDGIYEFDIELCDAYGQTADAPQRIVIANQRAAARRLVTSQV